MTPAARLTKKVERTRGRDSAPTAAARHSGVEARRIEAERVWGAAASKQASAIRIATDTRLLAVSPRPGRDRSIDALTRPSLPRRISRQHLEHGVVRKHELGDRDQLPSPVEPYGSNRNTAERGRRGLAPSRLGRRRTLDLRPRLERCHRSIVTRFDEKRRDRTNLFGQIQGTPDDDHERRAAVLGLHEGRLLGKAGSIGLRIRDQCTTAEPTAAGRECERRPEEGQKNLRGSATHVHRLTSSGVGDEGRRPDETGGDRRFSERGDASDAQPSAWAAPGAQPP